MPRPLCQFSDEDSAELFGRLAVAESGAGLGRNVAGIDLLAAMLAGEARVGDLAAGLVTQNDRWTLGAGEVRVAPAHESHDRREQVAPGRREPVLVTVGIAGVGDALEQAGVDELSQP